jgi:preprotein translocase subunit SecF
MQIIKYRKIWFLISGLLLALGAASLIFWKIPLGIDFTGGSLMEEEFPGKEVTTNQVRDALSDQGLSSLVVQPTDRGTFLVKTNPIDETKHQEILATLNQKVGETKESNFTTIGPTIGNALKRNAAIAVVLASFAIILYLSFAFRKVPKPASSWRFGLIAVATLLHDVLFTVGAFSVLAHFFGGFEVDSLFVVAVLTVMGFSVHDTIVVFDRIRENLQEQGSEDFEKTVNDSVVQTIARSLNTSLTVILVLLALYLLGGPTIHSFVVALLLGITVGTYSSIFIAAPLLVIWQRIATRK